MWSKNGDAGVDVGAAVSVQVDLHLDGGLLGVAGDRADAGHGLLLVIVGPDVIVHRTTTPDGAVRAVVPRRRISGGR